MSVSKESLHALIEIVNQQEYGVLYQLLLKFVPTDFPAQDEVDALKISRQQIENGEVYRAKDINWDNLDQMHLDG